MREKYLLPSHPDLPWSMSFVYVYDILCSEVSSLLLLANWDFLSPEVQLQASSHNYKGII